MIQEKDIESNIQKLTRTEEEDWGPHLPSPFDVGGTSSHTWVKIYMIEEHYYWKKHPLLFHDDKHIHGCIDDTSSSHLKSSCFI